MQNEKDVFASFERNGRCFYSVWRKRKKIWRRRRQKTLFRLFVGLWHVYHTFFNNDGHLVSSYSKRGARSGKFANFGRIFYIGWRKKEKRRKEKGEMRGLDSTQIDATPSREP